MLLEVLVCIAFIIALLPLACGVVESLWDLRGRIRASRVARQLTLCIQDAIYGKTLQLADPPSDLYIQANSSFSPSPTPQTQYRVRLARTEDPHVLCGILYPYDQEVPLGTFFVAV